MRKRSKKFIILIITLALSFVSVQANVAAYQTNETVFDDSVICDSVICDSYNCDNTLIADICLIDPGDIETNEWPWTDCSNVFGHNWGDWQVRTTVSTRAQAPMCTRIVVTERRVCQRTNCFVSETRDRITIYDHEWTREGIITVNGSRVERFRCLMWVTPFTDRCNAILDRPWSP
jgi:hypothetical protein